MGSEMCIRDRVLRVMVNIVVIDHTDKCNNRSEDKNDSQKINSFCPFLHAELLY